MKIFRLLFLAIVYAVVGNLYGQTTLELRNFDFPQWREIVSECTICGRTLRHYEEIKEPTYFDNMPSYWPDFNGRPQVSPEETPRTLMFDATNIAPVCFACELRYKNVWLEKYHKLFNKLKEQALEEHAAERIQWSESRKRNSIKKAKEAIEAAKQELYWLEHPEERPKPKTYGFQGWTDTISTYSIINMDTTETRAFIRSITADSVKSK